MHLEVLFDPFSTRFDAGHPHAPLRPNTILTTEAINEEKTISRRLKIGKSFVGKYPKKYEKLIIGSMLRKVLNKIINDHFRLYFDEKQPYLAK